MAAEVKKELRYFYIDGRPGWDQERFEDPDMNGGGCAAVTACDLCICLARDKGLGELYPFDPFNVTAKDYVAFSKIMRPYLYPRSRGIDTLGLYLAELSAYWSDRGARYMKGEELTGESDVREARELIVSQIENGILVPCLLLKHKDPVFDDFEWHWFNISGYEMREDGFYIEAVTYADTHWFSLERLWDTGYEEKGGLVKISFGENRANNRNEIP